jgi:phage-related protein
MSLDPIISDLQKTNPSAIIELFELELDSTLHGSQTTMTYRFHAGSNLDLNGKVVWQSNEYLRYPVEASGFAFQKGQLPRPQITISNALSLISAVMLEVNLITAGNDLTGAKVTRIRTLAKFLDVTNFASNGLFVQENSTDYIALEDSDLFAQESVSPGTPANNEFPREIYYVDRKVAENRDVVTFELASISDLAGIRLPKRQCTRDLFPSIGTFI